MSKVLIAILSDINKNDEVRLNNLYKRFEKEGYSIDVFDVKGESIILEHLPEIINYLKVQERNKHGIERITVLSNLKPILLSWYRCYNSIVNDFIFFLDSNDMGAHLLHTRHQDFINQLSYFNNIGSESIQDKVYLSLDINNIGKMGEFLLSNNRFIYFEDIRNFDFNTSPVKEIQSVYYIYKGLEFQFINGETSIVKRIKLDNVENSNISIDIDWLKLLKKNLYFSFYGPLIIYHMDLDLNKKNNILIYIFQQFSSWDICIQEQIYNQFLEFIKKESTNFIDKIFFLSLLVKLKYTNNILEEIFTTLKSDAINIHLHYPLLMSSLFYITKENLQVYPELFNDRFLVFDNIVNFYRDKVEIKKFNSKPKRIALIAGQMLSTKHSPTMLTLSYFNNLKKFLPDYEFKIFTEDIFVYNSNEVMFPYCFSSAVSSICRASHEEFLNYDPNIHYSDTTLDRGNRIQRDIDKVIEFKPQLLLVVGTDYSFIASYLKEMIPVINFSLGGAANPSNADIYIGGHNKEDILKEYCSFNISNVKYYQHHLGLSLPNPIKVTQRKEFNLQKEDYIMITVGNRLDAEMDNNFIDTICSFLNNCNNVKWLLVGKASHNYIREYYYNLVNERKIIFVDYADDLASLYQICDVYINPFRKGGGYSGALAMHQSLPVITLQNESDVAVYVGPKYSKKSKYDYEEEMIKLYSDKEYSSHISRQMKNRIDTNFGFENAINEMIKFLN